MGIDARPGNADGRFRSARFVAVSEQPLTVELFAGFAIREAEGCWHRIWPATRVPIAVGKATLYVPARTELITILRRFGRAKDLARAALLERAGGPA